MTLGRRLALLLAGIVAIAVPATGALAWLLAGPSLIEAVDELLGDQVDNFERVYEADPERLAAIRAADAGPLTQTTFRVQLIEDDGTVIGDTGLIAPPDEVRAARETGADRFRTVDIDDRTFRVLLRAVDGGVVQIATDIESIESGVSNLRRGITLSGTVAVIVAGGAGWVVARRFTKPIVEVTNAAAQLAERRGVPQPINTDRRDEVGRLAHSFNALVSALEISQQQQARLVADASHELRTPLTSLRVKVEFLQSEPTLPVGQRVSIIDGAALELEALSALVTELVDLAASNNDDETPQATNLGALVDDVAARARLTTGRTINTASEGTIASVRPLMIRRALSNLIGNAHKYSPADTPIEIAEFGGGIEVRDHGPGFDPDDRAHAFDRFYRSRAVQNVPGSGIGLAIVKQVADTHDGDVWIDDAQGGGAVVGFSVGGVRRTG